MLGCLFGWSGGREQTVTDSTFEEEATPAAEGVAGVVRDPADIEVAAGLVERARAEGASLVGPGGVLSDLTKQVLETALEAEITEHLGYPKHDPAGRDGGNSRNGTRTKTVLTDVGPVTVEVPRDREGSFEPQIVAKRQRRRRLRRPSRCSQSPG
jgi:putative transposase